MAPARTDGMVDAKTERIANSQSLAFSQMAMVARSKGLVWLRDNHLSDPTDPTHLSILISVMQLDLSSADEVTRRITEYRRVFSALRTTPEGRRAVLAVQDEYMHRVVNKQSSKLGQRPPLDSITEHTPAPQLCHNSQANLSLSQSARSKSAEADVPELAPDVAAQLGFIELIKLGQGGFGTVYAARQPSVGNRLVAIKYTSLQSREPQVLAALQHPNIMPVWSVHETGGHRVFCMPLHGRATMADVLKLIARTNSLPATGAEFLSAVSVTEPVASVALPAQVSTTNEAALALAEDAPEYESDRRRFSRLGYVDSVVQGMTRLADALAHAHRRRVVHLDIKPANILITDDGGFMILDFGLAYQNGLPTSPEAGGTVRYMAPEQLESFAAGKGVRPDPRMDLYALGLVFFELLTGRHPFAESLAPGKRREEWVAARKQHPPQLRRFNHSVPPGIEAVVRKLLHPDRDERYQTAEQLLTDLTRHQSHQPLQFAANPSVWERFVKFRRRHPVFTVACMAGLMAVFALGGYWVAHEQSQLAEAQTAIRESGEAKAQLQTMLADQTAIRIDAGSLQSAESRSNAIAISEKWWNAYHLDHAENWKLQPSYARLTEADQQIVMKTLGEYALLAAHAERLCALGRTVNEADAALARSVEWNRRAEVVFGGDCPLAVGEQRNALERLTGRSLPYLPAARPADSSDLFLRALGQIADGDHTLATATLEELEKLEPQHAAGQFALGYMYQSVGQFGKASVRYEVAKALAFQDPRAAYNRGAMNLYNRSPDEAVVDLSTALERDPKLVEAYYLRANGRLQMAMRMAAQGQRFSSALSDIETAIQLGGQRYRYIFLRSIIHRQSGDNAAANEDEQLLSKIAPEDDLDYICRGAQRNRQGAAPQALTDFVHATELNPLNPTAWHNLAAQQAALGQNLQAAEAYKRVIALIPELTSAKFKRAVLLARLGECEQAAELIDGLTPPDTECLMIKASVYALTSQLNLNDRTKAYKALQDAVRANAIDWDQYDQDTDFDFVRDLPQFVELREREGRPVE